jgi:hypothetical protein
MTTKKLRMTFVGGNLKVIALPAGRLSLSLTFRFPPATFLRFTLRLDNLE